MTGDVLADIVASVQERLQREAEPPGLLQRAREAAGVRRRGGLRSLAAALAEPGVRVIAECKRRSPSAGWLRREFDPVALAKAYEAGGAAAISVVTEPHFFAGQPGWIPLVRQAVTLPVLRKDFLISIRQLAESVLLGADAVLLIARCLPGLLLPELAAVAAELELEVLLEVHDEAELERALATAVPVIGINSRDLRTFSVDLEAAARLAALVPAGRAVVIESGIGGPASAAPLVVAGLRHILVGGALVRAEDPEAAVREIVACS